MRAIHLVLCLAAVPAYLAPASAQTLYKLIRPDGSVEYSDKPSRDAVRIERYELVPAVPLDPDRDAAQRADEQRRARQFDERERNREAAFDRADAEIKAAMQALPLAQQRLQDGAEPQPGELTGTTGGFARRNSAYYERMQRLSQDVSEATRRLDRAYTARNALRD